MTLVFLGLVFCFLVGIVTGFALVAYVLFRDLDK